MGKQRYSYSAKEVKEESLSKEERAKYEVGFVQGLVRKQWKSYIDDAFIDRLNNLGGDSKVLSKIYKDNFFSWLKAVSGDNWDCRKYSIEDYVNAVKFVSLRLLGNTILDSYKEVFPDRVVLVEKEYEGDSSKDYKLRDRLNWLASAYSKGKLVVKILQLTLVPSYIINAPLYDEALQKLADMIRNDEVKGMAKVKACEAILEATKQPEVIESNVNVKVGGVVRNEAMEELREVTEKLASTLKVELERGRHSLQEVVDIPLIKKDDNLEVANYGIE